MFYSWSLGIDSVTMVDAVMTRTEGLKIEKACQYVINDLLLGQLASTTRSVVQKALGQDDATTNHWRYLSSTFFSEDNPDIVIVGSADGRH
jgi:hypothetical protein